MRDFDVEKEFAKLDKIIQEMIVIPNEWLPKEYHDNVRGGRTAARLAEMCDAQESGISKTKQVKRLRLENVDNYRKQLEQNAEIDYNGHTDDLQLSKNQMALVAGMFNGGLLTEEDLLDG
tara:strand:- start:417 stop:776 length:360 start_codon:yes stop_codon:yes gene_type:complete